MLRALANFVGYRGLEWFMVGCFFGLFVEMLLVPDIILSSTFQYMVFSRQPTWLAVTFLLLSYLRALVLILNGRSYYYGPYLRAILAMAGAILWAMMSISLLRIVIDHQYLTTPVSIPIYVCLTLAELFTVYRASGDVRPSRGIENGRSTPVA